MTSPASATARRSRGCGASAGPRAAALAGAWAGVLAQWCCSVQRLAHPSPVKFFYIARRPRARARRFLAGTAAERVQASTRRRELISRLGQTKRADRYITEAWDFWCCCFYDSSASYESIRAFSGVVLNDVARQHAPGLRPTRPRQKNVRAQEAGVSLGSPTRHTNLSPRARPLVVAP